MFLALSASVLGNGNNETSTHASFANKKHSLTLKEWHKILGDVEPAAIKRLEKGGLIHVSDTTVVTDMRCTLSSCPKTPDLEEASHSDVTGMKKLLATSAC